MLISFLTLLLSFCFGILSGLYFRKKVPNFLGVILACVSGAFAGIFATYLILKFLLAIEVISNLNVDWFIRQCIWLSVLAVFGVILSAKAIKKSDAQHRSHQ